MTLTHRIVEPYVYYIYRLKLYITIVLGAVGLIYGKSQKSIIHVVLRENRILYSVREDVVISHTTHSYK